MTCITIKKPVFIGVTASILAISGERGKQLCSFRERKESARLTVAKRFIDSQVTLLSIFGRRAVLTDPLPPNLPDGATIEAVGRLCWVGEDGAIMIAIGEDA